MHPLIPLGVLTALSATATAAPSDPAPAPSSLALFELAEELQAPSGFAEAVAAGEGSLQFNYRFEEVDDDANSQGAHASTLRTVVDFRTAMYNGWGGYVQFENVSVIGDEAYNNASGTSSSTRPVVADPEGSELNQIYFDRTLGKSLLRVGRQDLNFHPRFVGNVGWRQNHQSFDAVSWHSQDALPADVIYAYVDNINRIFGEDGPNANVRSSAHLLNVQKALGESTDAMVFAYLLDLDQLPGQSTATFGLRLEHVIPQEGDSAYDGLIEVAQQSDYGDNPADVDALFYRVELGARFGQTRLFIGQEQLGSDDGTYGFSTPLATLHGENGWADVFLATPADGLVDTFIGVKSNVKGTKVAAIFHEFSSDEGSTDYGTELDLLATRKLRSDTLVGLKFAAYSADDFDDDLTKLWFWITWTPGA